jgi:transcriptional regulator with XRE-family HTH domain
MAGSGQFADDERCQDFVRNLVSLRTVTGWSQPELAAKCHFSKGVISNIESYQRAPRIEHGQGIDGAFKLTNVFEAKARAIQNQSYPEAFASFPEQEASADDIYIWEHSLVPGLLQTERYARAIFETLLDLLPDEVDRLVTARLARQDVLFREDGHRPRLWALVDESALSRPVASPKAMHEQCLRLLEVSRLPTVSLAVVPYSAGGHVGLTGACTVVERDGYPRIVNTDDIADGRVSDDPVIVKRVALRFRSLQHEAMSNGASRDTITRMAEAWEAQAKTGERAPTAAPTAVSV